MRITRFVRAVVVAAVLLMPMAHAANFKGKTISIITSTGVGGTYDVSARVMARYMPKYLVGNPTMIVQNMPGGGNVLATNYMYNIAPKDGTAIAVLHDSMPLYQAMGGQGVRFDATKFGWLGSLGPANSALFVWHTAGVNSFADLRSKQVVLGGTGAGSGIVIFPTVMNQMLGTKFQIVTGYKSSDEINIALQRGEVQARTLGLSSVFSQQQDWIRDKNIVFLAQIGPHRDKRIPDVPLWTEFATTDEQRSVLNLVASPTLLGTPVAAPPGVSPDTLADLRKALAAVMADKDFQADMKKLRIDLDPMGPDEVTRIVDTTVNAPASSIALARTFMKSSP